MAWKTKAQLAMQPGKPVLPKSAPKKKYAGKTMKLSALVRATKSGY